MSILFANMLLSALMLSSQEFVIIGHCRPVMYDSLDLQRGQPGLCDPHPRVSIHPCDMRSFLLRWVKNGSSGGGNQLCTGERGILGEEEGLRPGSGAHVEGQHYSAQGGYELCMF